LEFEQLLFEQLQFEQLLFEQFKHLWFDYFTISPAFHTVNNLAGKQIQREKMWKLKT
jgi:hypothetical protein